MYEISQLDNGIRIVTENVPYVESVAFGLWIGTGAKHERPGEHGFAHFLEHMLFKGTERRSAKDIADEMASVGGNMNAATDREYTTYYARVLKEYVPLAVDILTDMLRNSMFDPQELEREKDVIADEIRRHVDQPEENVHDVMAELAWGDHRLGHSVAGDEATVRSASSETLQAYLATHYTPDRIVVSAAGNLDHAQIVDLTAQALGTMTGADERPALPPVEHHPGRRVVDKDTESVYFCLGAPGYAEMDNRKYRLSVLDSVLGGGMSSRLFQEVREKRGLAYDIGSYRVSYREGGLFAVYGGTGRTALGEVLKLVRQEIAKVREHEVDETELARARTQIRGALLMAQESMGSRMSRMGKTLLDHDRPVSADEVIEKVLAVTAPQVREAADELLQPDGTSTAVIGPSGDVEKAFEYL